MPDLQAQLKLLRDAGVRTAHFNADGTLKSVEFEADDPPPADDDDDEGDSPRTKMARNAAAVLTGRAKTMNEAEE